MPGNRVPNRIFLNDLQNLPLQCTQKSNRDLSQLRREIEYQKRAVTRARPRPEQVVRLDISEPEARLLTQYYEERPLPEARGKILIRRHLVWRLGLEGFHRFAWILPAYRRPEPKRIIREDQWLQHPGDVLVGFDDPELWDPMEWLRTNHPAFSVPEIVGALLNNNPILAMKGAYYENKRKQHARGQPIATAAASQAKEGRANIICPVYDGFYEALSSPADYSKAALVDQTWRYFRDRRKKYGSYGFGKKTIERATKSKHIAMEAEAARIRDQRYQAECRRRFHEHYVATRTPSRPS